MRSDLTIDREPLRKRFEGALVGFLANGKTSILIPGPPRKQDSFYVDLMSGYIVNNENLKNYERIIRPGDACDVDDYRGKPERCVYYGFSGSTEHPFRIQRGWIKSHGTRVMPPITYEDNISPASAEPATDSEATADEAALKRLWERGKEAWKNIGPSATAWVDEMRGNAVEPEGEVPTLKPCIVCNGKADETRVYDTHCLNTQCPLYAISMSKEKWNAAVRPTEPMNYGAATLLRQAQEEIRRHKPADGPKPEDYESCPKCKSSFSFCRPFSDGVCPQCGHSLLETAPAAEVKRYTMDDFKQGRICVYFGNEPNPVTAIKEFLKHCTGFKWFGSNAPAADYSPSSDTTYLFCRRNGELTFGDVTCLHDNEIAVFPADIDYPTIEEPEDTSRICPLCKGPLKELTAEEIILNRICIPGEDKLICRKCGITVYTWINPRKPAAKVTPHRGRWRACR